MAKNNGNTGKDIPWALIAIGFIFWWPLGLGLLVAKMVGSVNSGNAAKEQRTTTPPRYATHSMYSAVSEPHKASDRSGSYNTSASAEKIKSTSGKKGLNTKVLTVLGAIALGIGGVMTLGGMAEALSWLGSSYFIEELWTNVIAPLIGFGGTGGILLWAAATIRGYENRKKSYQAYLGNNKTVNLKEMSARLGVPYRKVKSDIRKWIASGELGGAYHDVATDELVLPGAERPSIVKKPPKKEDLRTENEKILDEIAQLNVDIKDEEVSRKIDRIEYVTRRIFQAVEERPEKSSQLDKFMKYYLPNTLKMLRAYAQFEEQKVRGENITSAMKNIEDILDKLVAGFEKQLDRLFEDEAVDISTDITVLEGMLKKDGYGDEDFQLK